MNMSSDGSLHPVTVAQTLDLPMTPKKGCERFGVWVATYGAEDPRLFWTVSGAIRDGTTRLETGRGEARRDGAGRDEALASSRRDEIRIPIQSHGAEAN
jgi:hypothetical protein